MKKFHIAESFVTEEGYPALIVLIGGHYNGYIGLDKENSLYGVDIHSLPDFKVHGGVTFSDFRPKFDEYVNKSNLWWIGFDTMHANDKENYDLAIKYLAENEEEVEYFKNLKKIDLIFSKSMDSSEETFKDKEYVRKEIMTLSKQIKAYNDNGDNDTNVGNFH